MSVIDVCFEMFTKRELFCGNGIIANTNNSSIYQSKQLILTLFIARVVQRNIWHVSSILTHTSYFIQYVIHNHHFPYPFSKNWFTSTSSFLIFLECTRLLIPFLCAPYYSLTFPLS